MRLDYDVVVIGSGLGGLTCAAYCARAGRSVAVFEQYHNIGGCCQSFRRGEFLFDASVHSVLWSRHMVRIVEELGQHIDVIRTGDSLRFPGVRLPLDTIPQVRDDLARLFPAEKDAIHAYYTDLCAVVTSLLRRFVSKERATADPGLRFGSFYKYFGKTTSDIIDQYFTSPELRALAFCAQMGFLPDRAWLFTAYHIYMERNFYHDNVLIAGGTQRLPDGLAAAIRGAGSDIFTNRLVRRILIEDGQAAGVELDDGTPVRARHVVSNADARLTFGTLIPPEYVEPGIQRDLNSWRNSISFVVANLGLAGDVSRLGPDGTNIAYFPTYDVVRMVRDLEAGVLSDDFWLGMSFPTIVDPSRPPADGSVVFLLVPVGYNACNSWGVGEDYRFDGLRPRGKRGAGYAENKRRVADMIIARAEELFPGIKAHIARKNVITPISIERITLNNRGTGLAWMLRPHELKVDMGLGLPIASRIAGFHYVGAWTQLGCGVSMSMLSGKTAAYHILGLPEGEVFRYEWEERYVKE